MTNLFFVFSSQLFSYELDNYICGMKLQFNEQKQELISNEDELFNSPWKFVGRAETHEIQGFIKAFNEKKQIENFGAVNVETLRDWFDKYLRYLQK